VGLIRKDRLRQWARPIEATPPPGIAVLALAVAEGAGAVCCCLVRSGRRRPGAPGAAARPAEVSFSVEHRSGKGAGWPSGHVQ
jgi:hypothetical protein